MIIERINYLEYTLKMNNEDIRVIVNAVKYVIENLNEELSIRTGFSIKEYENLINKINGNNLKNHSFAKEEVVMIHQAFNEVCNGVFINDFEQEIGLPLFEVKKMLESLDKALDD